MDLARCEISLYLFYMYKNNIKAMVLLKSKALKIN